MFLDKDQAELFASVGADSRVEEWDTDNVWSDDIDWNRARNGVLLWYACMDKDGGNARAYKLGCPSAINSWNSPGWCISIIRRSDKVSSIDCRVWARNERAAIQSLNNIRARVTANNLWNATSTRWRSMSDLGMIEEGDCV